MKIEYDVKKPLMRESHAKYLEPLINFIESEHESVKFSFDDLKEAKSAYIAMYGYLDRNALRDDIHMSRRHDVIYIERMHYDY